MQQMIVSRGVLFVTGLHALSFSCGGNETDVITYFIINSFIIFNCLRWTKIMAFSEVY